MTAIRTRSAILLALASPASMADSAQSQANGFIEDSTWAVLNRSVYDRRDYQHGSSNSSARNAYKARSERNDYAEEWAYGLMGTLQSGFTQGLIGVGVDAHAYLGVKLDSGGGRAGKARLLGLDNETILHRLYHEETVRLFDGQAIEFKCSCSRERSGNALTSLGLEDAQKVVSEHGGHLEIDCQFCNERYLFDAADVDQLFAGAGVDSPSETHH